MNPVISNLISGSYKGMVKPLLFNFDAETVHNSATLIGKSVGNNPVLKFATKSLFSYSSPKLSKTIDGIEFPNPIGLSAGFDYNGELTGILPAVGFGWHTIGTVTYQSYQGNPKPRLGRFPDSKAILVNKGLKTWGAEKVIEYLQRQSFSIPTAISIASTNTHFDSVEEQLQDIARCFDAFEHSSLNHALYEMNISCPNTFGGEPFTEPARLDVLLTMLDKLSISKPVYVKMPIDQSEKETSAMMKVIHGHNIQGLIFGNLTKDHTNPAVTDFDKKQWAVKKGNLSGKPTWERSLKLLKLAKKEYPARFTLVGTGGIFNGEDAAEKMAAGADLLQLITGMIFEGPQVIGQINHHLVHNKLTN